MGDEIPIHQRIKRIHNKIEDLEIKIDTLIARETPTIDLTAITELLTQLSLKVEEIKTIIQPGEPVDYQAQALAAIATLQQLQAQLQAQAQQINIPEE